MNKKLKLNFMILWSSISGFLWPGLFIGRRPTFVDGSGVAMDGDTHSSYNALVPST
jgi:hypothetical protein